MKYTRHIIFKRILRYIPVSKITIILTGVLTLAVATASLISPYLYKLIIDDVMAKGNITLLYYIIPTMLGVYIIKAALQICSGIIAAKFSHNLTFEVKKSVMKRLLHQGIAQANQTHTGIQANNLEKDTSEVHTFISNHIVGFTTATIMVTLYTILMVLINPWLWIISIILVPLTIWLYRLIGRKFKAVNKETHQANSNITSFLFETIRKWREIKFNALEKRFVEEYDHKLELSRTLGSKWMLYFSLRDVLHLIKDDFIIKVLIYFLGGLFVISEQITIGDLLVFISFMENMNISLTTIMNSYTGFLGQEPTFDRLFNILDTPLKSSGKECPSCPSFDLENVCYSYPNTDTTVFTDINCTFQYGKKYLLKGESGSGKTTLIKLLLGILQPETGRVLLNNIPSKDIISQSLFQSIGVVMQDNTFFNFSIRENLLLVAPDAKEEDLVNALTASVLDEFVDSLPQKLDTIIGEQGIKLSGGQKQRLAIARLILQDPQILILDEATSALDSIVEERIINNLNMLFKDRTIVFISHKPLTNYKPDQTLIVKDKQIIQSFN